MRFLPAPQDTPRVNLTPLIDVVFLLLIFLMVSTSFVDSSSLNINLPQASEQAPPRQGNLEVSVTRNGEWLIDGEVVEAALLYPKLEAIALKYIASGEDLNTVSVRVNADQQASHGDVVRVMDSLSRAGFASVAIATLYNGQDPQNKEK